MGQISDQTPDSPSTTHWLSRLCCAASLSPPVRLRLLQDRFLVSALLDEGQGHLFSHWHPPGEHDEDKRRLLRQLRHLDTHYSGGLLKYIANARKLLKDSKDGACCGLGVEGVTRVRGCVYAPQCAGRFVLHV
jgi:hypothetical protein